MRLQQLLKDIDYIKIEGTLDRIIESMHYDSREATYGSLFFCIRGLRVDGHDYAPQAIDNGAKALVLERDVETEGDITKIYVRDTKTAMAHMSKNYYRDPTRGIKLIGITGTNGKTTIAYLIKSILEKSGQKVGLIGTITNMLGDKKIPSKYTTPESLELQGIIREMADGGADTIVMEVSSHSLSLGRVIGLWFDVGVFTNLSQDHLDFHADMEEYFNAKVKLFTQSNTAIINIDDDKGSWLSAEVPVPKITYGIEKVADVYARDLVVNDRGIRFCLYTPEGSTSIDLGIPGTFSVYNALAAAGACHTLGISLDNIYQGLNEVRGVSGRFELLDTDTDYKVIIDYAHTPDGLENILRTAQGFTKGRVVTLFGCGGDRDHGKRPLMGQIAGEHSDFCILTSDNPRSEIPVDIIMDILPGLKKTGCPYVIIENRRKAIEYALDKARKDDVIILAGKGHETYQVLKDETIHFNEKEIVYEILGRECV